MIFSTLFDSNYLDKGLVLFDSMCKNIGDFKLYVIAFDDKCYDVLSDIKDSRLIVISLQEFETPVLLEAKSNRNARCYSWTCGCHSILHVLQHYNEPMCTYIDADMYFYSTPQVLIDDIVTSGANVSVIRHGFMDVPANDEMRAMSGEYCVEFNTFFNNEAGLAALQWWCDQCIESCIEFQDGTAFGDQKYIEEMVKIFPNVHEINHIGAGVAPWNVGRFEAVSLKGDNVEIKDRMNGKEAELIFYHYHAVHYVTRHMISISTAAYPGTVDKKLIKHLYGGYMSQIESKRKMLAKTYSLQQFNKLIYSEAFSLKSWIFTYRKNLLWCK